MLDDADQALVDILRRDGRAPVTALAERLRLPRSTVQERLRRLVDRGVITHFEARVDGAKVGKPVQAFLLATFLPGTGVSQREVARTLAGLPDVEEAHLIGGDWDILLRVRGASLEAIGELVLDRIRDVPGIARTLTCPVFQSVEGDPSAAPAKRGSSG